MLPGTRFYYDRNGRYRGKASDYGPVTHGIWAIAGIAIVGFAVVEWLANNWWWIALIGAFAIGFISLICLLTGRSFGACAAGMAISVLAVSALLVLQPMIARHLKKTVSEKPPAENVQPLPPERSAAVAPTQENSQPLVNHAAAAGPVLAPQVTGLQDKSPTVDDDLRKVVRPSFNCEMATQNAEQIVCSNHDLARLDAEVDALYRQSRSVAADPSALKQSQRNWKYYERNLCRTRPCLRRAYQERKEYLASLFGR